MKAADVIKQLFAYLPRFTNLFTEELDIESIVRAPLDPAEIIVTTTIEHNLTTNDYVNIVNVPYYLQISNLTQIDNIATATTIGYHNLTAGFKFNKYINISGADQIQYNGEHKLLTTPTPNTFTFQITGNPTSPATGSIFLLDYATDFYNGFFKIKTILDATRFSYELENPGSDIVLQNIDDMKVRYDHRISGSITNERAIESYTKQAINKLWAYVVLGDRPASKNGETRTDNTTYVRASSQLVRQRIVLPFNVVVIVPTSNEIAARIARDLMEDVCKYLINSLLGVRLPNEFAENQWSAITFDGHQMYQYVGPYYVHLFSFNSSSEITYDDSVKNYKSVVFRNINLNFLDEADSLLMEAGIKLDEN